MFFFLLLNARPITFFYYLYFLLLYFIYSKIILQNPSKRVKKNIFSRRREKRIRGVPEYLLTYKRITKQKKVLKQQEPRP